MKSRNRLPIFLGLISLLAVLTSPLARTLPAEKGQASSPAAQASEDRIDYELTPQIASKPRRLQVVMHFGVGGQAEPIRVQMPVWSPGDYHVQNHARYVREVRAWEGKPEVGRPLAVTHPDPNTWQIAAEGAKLVSLTYSLPETPPGFFSENVQVRERQAFINGPSALMYLVGGKERPAQLAVHLPTGWLAETALPSVEENDTRTRRFLAPDYDTLADSPLLMAAKNAQTAREFTLNGKPHRAVFFGHSERITEPDAYLPLLRRIAEAERKIMGVNSPPYDRYTFLFDVDGRGGALEHANSFRLPLPSEVEPRRVAPFIAHEFFHLWNVKRVRPAVLGPFDYVHPPRTRNLWFAEGVTEYYANIATFRAGLSSPADFFSQWRDSIREMQENPARLAVSADDSSLKVWEAGNSTGFGISYYLKGELIGLCLDLKIRALTDGKRSLDDVMRTLMQRYSPPRAGYGEEALRAVVSEVAGQDLSAFYDRLARSTQELPLAECLEYAGLDAEASPLRDASPAQLALRQSWMHGTP